MTIVMGNVTLKPEEADTNPDGDQPRTFVESRYVLKSFALCYHCD